MASRQALKIFTIVLAAIPLGSLSSSCGSDANHGSGQNECKASRCAPFDGSPADAYVYDSGIVDAFDASDGSTLSGLCGRHPACNPDDAGACAGYAPGDADAASSLDAQAESGTRGPGSSDAALLGPSDAGGRLYGCSVRLELDQPGAACERAGAGALDSPCLTSADCAAGLACVGDAGGAQCRPYCCAGADVCKKGSFCAKRSLKQAGTSRVPLAVPVCVVADQCDLTQPYPCPSDLRNKGQCTCPDEATACIAVRGDGTTSCVKPGTGKISDDCSEDSPCAWGHVCSQATGKCLKLCSTISSEDVCSGGICQASAYLPQDLGVCVGDVR
jgi:hypothetical protein